MAWIEVLDENEVKAANDDLAKLYARGAHPQTGQVDNVLQIHSLRPASLEGHLKLYFAAMHAKGGLSRREREVLAVAVSAFNECHY